MNDLASLKFVPFGNEDHKEWDQFVEKNPSCWAYHLSAFVKAEASVRKGEDSSYSIRLGGNIVGICCLYIEKRGLGKILTGVGPAVDPSLSSLELEKYLYEWCETLAISRGCVSIRLHLCSFGPAGHALRYFNSPLAEFRYGFGYRGDSLDYEAGYWIISNLSRSAENILSDFSKGNKASVKRCAKLNLTSMISSAGDVDDRVWKDFVSLNVETLERNNISPASGEYFEHLRNALNMGRAYLINLYVKHTCLVAIYLYSYKNVAYYEAAGSTPEALRIGALAYAHYVAMCELKARSVEYYCMGPDVPSSSRKKDRQISDFKRRFGSEKWDILIGEKILYYRRYRLLILFPCFLKLQISGTRTYAFLRAAKNRLQRRS